MKQEPSFFEGQEPVLIYIAKKLRHALRLETVLTEAGVDYGVEAGEYRGGVIFSSVRAGAFFYVLPNSVAVAHEVMLPNGFKPHAGPVGWKKWGGMGSCAAVGSRRPSSAALAGSRGWGEDACATGGYFAGADTTFQPST